ncbi:UNVERIFIED_ORG: sugar/nucleoside kinase (ribokinase family) [Arthrobacter sp. UYEF10]
MSSATAGSQARIVVVGSLNADLTIYCERLPLPGETVHGNGFAVYPGGKSANQAVAASLLGGDVSLVGAVGVDANGDMLLSSAAGAGVEVSGVRTSATEATGVAVIAVDSNGENNIIISAGANGTLSPADVAARRKRSTAPRWSVSALRSALTRWSPLPGQGATPAPQFC